MEVFLGIVEAIDREGGRVTVRVLGDSGTVSADGGQSAEDSVTVEITHERMPRHLQTGDPVRVWGEFTGRDSAVFRADTIRSGGRGGRGGDPTGVRSRLGRGRFGGGPGGGGPGRR